MNFEEALRLLKEGHRMSRTGWNYDVTSNNGIYMFIFLVPGSTFKVNRPPLLGIYEEGKEINYQPHIDIKTSDGTIVPWICTQTDMLAEDWNIIVGRNT